MILKDSALPVGFPKFIVPRTTSEIIRPDLPKRRHFIVASSVRPSVILRQGLSQDEDGFSQVVPHQIFSSLLISAADCINDSEVILNAFIRRLDQAFGGNHLIAVDDDVVSLQDAFQKLFSADVEQKIVEPAVFSVLYPCGSVNLTT